MQTLIDLFVHLDKHLPQLAGAYGPWVYGLLFLIIFAETGLVVTPFLPGDSLLFAAGALAARGIARTSGVELVRLLLVAAILGDAVNYAVGRTSGRGLHRTTTSGLLHQLLNREHLRKAHAFFEKLRRQGRRARPLRADRPHVRAVRRRRGAMTYPSSPSTTSPAPSSGSASASAPATPSATCRS